MVVLAVIQGCQMVYLHTKNPNFGIFVSLEWKILVFYGNVEYFGVIWYIFSHFGILDQEKFGNPALICDLNTYEWPCFG
jgi:hypothetical protein